MPPRAFSGRWGLSFSPATTNLKAMLAGQSHHLMVMAAVLELLAYIRVGFAEGYEGIELSHLLKELLELGFGHG
jgi:hypothetical protein